jgi:hypothetical protein
LLKKAAPKGHFLQKLVIDEKNLLSTPVKGLFTAATEAQTPPLRERNLKKN